MQRKRGELVPIGEVFSDLGGPVKAIREASPQARHHFTQADQVNQLVGASEADADLGFHSTNNGAVQLAALQPPAIGFSTSASTARISSSCRPPESSPSETSPAC